MAVKYICPKCGRRFVDWGAEKLQYKCPSEECNGETLVLPGSENEEPEERPALKRSRKRKSGPSVASALDIVEMDGTFIESDDNVDDDDDDDVDLEEDSAIEKEDESDDTDTESLLEDDDDAIEEEGDDTFADALDIDGDDAPPDED